MDLKQEEFPIVHALKCLAFSASLLLGLASAAPAFAQTHNEPWVQIESTSINLGVGMQSGDGVLHLPNLGTNCEYPFTIEGFGVGAHVGVSAVSASGPVKNLTKVADLPGEYSTTEGEATVLAGAGAVSMKNDHNNVIIDLTSHTKGLALGIGAQSMTVKLAPPATGGRRTYVLEFGFNKTWVNQESREDLDQAVKAWKCRYVKFELVGHTDAVGKEAANLQLAAKRAQTVRNYLVGAGIVPTRITVRSAGENEPLVPTANGVRLRANRAVVLAVTD